jgi:hypothetical protein
VKNAFIKPEVERFVLEVCTKLVFVSLHGEKREVMLTKRIVDYMELQCEVARYTKKSKLSCCVQDENGDLIPDLPIQSNPILPPSHFFVPREVKKYPRVAAGGQLRSPPTLNSRGGALGSFQNLNRG